MRSALDFSRSEVGYEFVCFRPLLSPEHAVIRVAPWPTVLLYELSQFLESGAVVDLSVFVSRSSPRDAFYRPPRLVRCLWVREITNTVIIIKRHICWWLFFSLFFFSQNYYIFIFYWNTILYFRYGRLFLLLFNCMKDRRCLPQQCRSLSRRVWY